MSKDTEGGFELSLGTRNFKLGLVEQREGFSDWGIARDAGGSFC